MSKPHCSLNKLSETTLHATQKLELLSPARNLECGKAAIDHGADAVYIGAPKYGARAAVGNSISDIEQLCAYAHDFGAKVYVTVNTIVYDEEAADVLKMVQELHQAGVDAILVQDMGLLKLIAESDINITLHASTQTDNRTIEKVRWLSSLGIKRVVLARELSIAEIEKIHNAVPEVELEVFVHGALCVSYSGQCYASWCTLGRSANRGECAQVCRMAYDIIDADGRLIARDKHPLSLKDMSQLANLERLAKAGAISFKIEGRLKAIEYVKNITAAYSQRLDEICHNNSEKYSRASLGHTTYTFSPNIHKTFNRGYTTYFADGRSKHLAALDSPKSIGSKVGTVKAIKGNSISVSSITPFANGDGLCFFNNKEKLVGFRVNKVENNKLYLQSIPEGLRPGTTLYRNHDQQFYTLLTKQSAERKIDVAIKLQINQDTITLTIALDGGIATISHSEPYIYEKAERNQTENIKKQLTRLGNTPFVCTDFAIESAFESPFVCNSQLTALRREAVGKLLCQIRTMGIKTSTMGIKTSAVGKNNAQRTNAFSHVAPPPYDSPEMYNATNKHAIAFYEEQGIHAAGIEPQHESSAKMPLMQCRYCLKSELGYCSKTKVETPWREPLRIRQSDGQTFRLTFNCKKCEMYVSLDI